MLWILKYAVRWTYEGKPTENAFLDKASAVRYLNKVVLDWGHPEAKLIRLPEPQEA